MNLLQLTTLACAVASLALGGGIAHANLVVIADYHLGEADLGASPGQVSNGTVDSSGNGFNLTTVIGDPTYESGGAFAGSTLSMSFDGSSYLAGPIVTNDTENFGITLYAKTSDPDQALGALAINGTGCCSGFGLFVQDGEYYGLYGGLDIFDIGPVSDDAWDEIGLFNVNGDTQILYNGAYTELGLVGDPYAANDPCGDGCIPSTPIAMTIGSDGENDFIGDIDEVQVYAAPEPGTIALFASALAGFAALRRRETATQGSRCRARGRRNEAAA